MLSSELPRVATGVSITAGGTTAMAGAAQYYGHTLNDWALMTGIVVTVLTFLVSTVLNILRYRQDCRRAKEGKD